MCLPFVPQSKAPHPKEPNVEVVAFVEVFVRYSTIPVSALLLLTTPIRGIFLMSLP